MLLAPGEDNLLLVKTIGHYVHRFLNIESFKAYLRPNGQAVPDPPYFS